MSLTARPRQPAIVLGASLAGLFTARVLSNYFDRVIVLERDPVGPAAAARKGQPQTRHLHGLLASGMEILTRYYPDLPETLSQHGAVLQDFAENMQWHTYGGYRQRFHMGLKSALVSRPLLEAIVREMTLARPGVTLIDECAVLGLETAPDRARVTGVRVERRGSAGPAEVLAADLVVDCTGRGSRTPQWLPALGYAAPAESEVTVNVGYATRVFRRDPADPRGREWILTTPAAPAQTRFGGMFPIEGDRWIVSMGGWSGDHAPMDEAGFLEYARSLPAPDIYNIISRAEPLSEIMPYKFAASLRRHYEHLTRFPEGFLVVGDAVCSFNPTYGQGMTSAAMQAAALDDLVRHRGPAAPNLAREFFKRVAQIVDIPWQLAVGEDFRFPDTVGPKPPGVDLINRYVAQVHRATLVDPDVCRAFVQVMNLLAPPASLMAPAMMWRVWRANRRLAARRPAAAPQPAPGLPGD